MLWLLLRCCRARTGRQCWNYTLLKLLLAIGFKIAQLLLLRRPFRPLSSPPFGRSRSRCSGHCFSTINCPWLLLVFHGGGRTVFRFIRQSKRQTFARPHTLSARCSLALARCQFYLCDARKPLAIWKCCAALSYSVDDHLLFLLRIRYKLMLDMSVHTSFRSFSLSFCFPFFALDASSGCFCFSFVPLSGPFCFYFCVCELIRTKGIPSGKGTNKKRKPNEISIRYCRLSESGTMKQEKCVSAFRSRSLFLHFFISLFGYCCRFSSARQ